MSSWRRSAAAIASRSASHSRVEPSTSVNNSVTVPDGGPLIDTPPARTASPGPPPDRRFPSKSAGCQECSGRPLPRPDAPRRAPTGALEGEGFQVYGVGHGLGAFVVEVHAVAGVHDGVDVVRGSGVLDSSGHIKDACSPPDGSPVDCSEWAPVVTSEPVARALLLELGLWARRTAEQGARIALPGPGARRSTAAEREQLNTVCQWLQVLDSAVRAAQHRRTDPPRRDVPAGERELVPGPDHRLVPPYRHLQHSDQPQPRDPATRPGHSRRAARLRWLSRQAARIRRRRGTGPIGGFRRLARRSRRG
jgi:hypothetical protein